MPSSAVYVSYAHEARALAIAREVGSADVAVAFAELVRQVATD